MSTTTTLETPKVDPRRLIAARKDKGLTQAQVARETGFDRRQIWQFEQGVSLTLENFTRLMLFYDKPFEYFFTPERES